MGDAAEGRGMRRTFIVPAIRSFDHYDFTRAKISCSLAWLVAKAFGSGRFRRQVAHIGGHHRRDRHPACLRVDSTRDFLSISDKRKKDLEILRGMPIVCVFLQLWDVIMGSVTTAQVAAI